MPGDVAQSEELGRLLYRPVVFLQPNRVVEPTSWVEHIPFAFWIVDELRPEVIVELGTQSGNSYAGFAQAIQTLGLTTAAYAVDTWKGDSHSGFYEEDVFAEWAAYHDRHFSAFSRLVRSTFDEAAAHFQDGTVDLLHIDGLHTYEAAAADFALWRPKLSRRGVVLLHDINVRERDFGTWRLWEELRAAYPSFTFLHGHGLGVLAIGSDRPHGVEWLCGLHAAEEISYVRQFFAQTGGAIAARFTAEEQQVSAAAQAADALELQRAHDAALAQTVALRQQVDAAAAQTHARDLELAQEREARALIEEALAGTRSELESATADLAAGQEQLEWSTRAIAELRSRLWKVNERRPAAGAADPGPSPDSRRLARQLSRARPILRIPIDLGFIPRSRRWSPSTILRFAASRTRRRDAYVIARSRLFDSAYYVATNPDVGRSSLAPLAHFILRGGREGRSPHPLFDAAYYLEQNPDVAAAGLNPLVHYLLGGAYEGRKPHPLFDVSYYLAQNPDVRAAGIDPLGHFLRFGVADGRNPNPYFDCAYYMKEYADVAGSGCNPLIHFVCDGWRERRRPSRSFDIDYYLSENPDVAALESNPLAHFLELGASEGRAPFGEDDPDADMEAVTEPPPVRMEAHRLGKPHGERPTVLCLSHVSPWPPRAGNEYRLYRLLRWLHARGFRVVPVIAPLPGERVDRDALQRIAADFGNVVLCDRSGRLEYVLGEGPDVLASLGGEFVRPVSLLLDDDQERSQHAEELIEMERTFCHDALITAALRLNDVLRPTVLLLEYIWMTRLLPLVSGDPVVVVDTIDVFSTKRAKVLQYGIDDLHVEPEEEARRLRGADLILAIQDREEADLRQLVPEKQVVVAGVDFDVVADGGAPEGRRILYVASDNPMNRKGLHDFLRFAWPQVRQLVPSAELVVAGRIASTVHEEFPGVITLGPVDDLTALYREARAVINPAIAGTGVKIKTLEALGHLRPIVTWPTGVDGLAPELAALCTQATDWYEFSRRVAELLAADTPRLFSAGERDAIERFLSPSAAYATMTAAIEALVRERMPQSALENSSLA